jgi:hypothetical protein
MFPELRAVQIEVPRDVLEMREGSGEAPALEAGASFLTVCAHSREDPSESRTTSLMEPFGALPSEVAEANLLKNMVGPCGLEPQTSTVSKIMGYMSLRKGIDSLFRKNAPDCCSQSHTLRHALKRCGHTLANRRKDDSTWDCSGD